MLGHGGNRNCLGVTEAERKSRKGCAKECRLAHYVLDPGFRPRTASTAPLLGDGYRPRRPSLDLGEVPSLTGSLSIIKPVTTHEHDVHDDRRASE
jgi:hypothetical protein